MTTSAGDSDRADNDGPGRHLHLVPASLLSPATADNLAPDRSPDPAGDCCFRCDKQPVEPVYLVAAHPNQPPRPPVALCEIHRARHASGAEGIGWCERGAHHGLSATYCDIHLGTIV